MAAQRLRFFVLTGEGKGVEGAAAGKQGKRRERKKKSSRSGEEDGKGFDKVAKTEKKIKKQ